jgi:sodium-dependent dicarboxylate transporter 2/3/5
VDSGLALLIRSKLEVLSFMNLFLLLVIVSGIVLFFTEFTSNTSTITVFAPILGRMSIK